MTDHLTLINRSVHFSNTIACKSVLWLVYSFYTIQPLKPLNHVINTMTGTSGNIIYAIQDTFHWVRHEERT